MNKNEIIQYLKSHTVLSGLDTEQLGVLADKAEEKWVGAGELLFKQDEPAEHFYILLDGSIEVGIPSISGPELIVQSLGRDDILGWSWLISPYKWAFEAKAQTDSKLLSFDGKSLLQYCEKHNDFGYALMKRFTSLMSDRLHAARMRMMENWSPPGWA